MIAKSLVLLFVVAAAFANESLVGVDPNTLSCDPAGQIFLLLPHFTNCSKFFMCAHGKEVEFDCPSENLIFDFELQTCNWAWATTCVLRKAKGDEDNSEEEGSGQEINWSSEDLPDVPNSVPIGIVRPVETEIETRTLPKFEKILDCSKPDEASRQVFYKGDCQRYWRCLGGVAQVFYCNDGLYFNDRTQQCDFEANVRCGVQIEEELGGEFIVYNK